MAVFTARDPTDRDAFTAHWRRNLGDPAVTTRTIVFQRRVVGRVSVCTDEEFGKPEVTYWIGREP